MLGQGRGFVCVFGAFHLPDNEVPDPDQEWDDPDSPGAAFPVVNGAEEDHEAEADHHQDNPPAHIGPSPHSLRWGKQRCWHRLPLCHHLANRPVKGAAPEITKEHYRGDDQHWCAKQGRKNDSDDRNRHERAVLDVEVAITVVTMVPIDRNGRAAAGYAEMPAQFLVYAALNGFLIVGSGGDRRRDARAGAGGGHGGCRNGGCGGWSRRLAECSQSESDRTES